jgi:two-component system sensor histidine kinase HydH
MANNPPGHITPAFRRPGTWATVLTVTLSMFLVVLWVAAYWMVRQAANNHLEALAFQGVVAMESAFRRGRPPDIEGLQAVVQDIESDGLRALMVVTREGRVIASSVEGPTERPDLAVLALSALASGEVRSGLARDLDGRPVFRAAVPRRRPPVGPGPRRQRGIFGGGSFGEIAMVIEVDPAPAMRMWHWVWAQGAASLAVIAFMVWGLVRSRRAAVLLATMEASARRRELLATLGEMSALMAHEVRNPLAALKGHVQLASENAGDPQAVRSRLDTVLAEVSRLESLVRGLLEYTSDRPAHRESMRLAEVVARGVSRIVDPETAGDLPGVELDCDPDLVLSLDPDGVAGMVSNLVQNALEAAGAEGRVRVTAAGFGNEAIIVVEDSGNGIPVELGERVFDPFVTGRIRGIGLGLAMVRKSAESHGGTVTAGRSEKLGGARFEVRLPLEPI